MSRSCEGELAILSEGHVVVDVCAECKSCEMFSVPVPVYCMEFVSVVC